MPRFTGFSPVPIRGPRPLPLVGPVPSLLRFFGDPVGKMAALHREFGDVAAVVDRNPALVCAFGAQHNREVITRSATFQHNTDFFFKIPRGSAMETFNISLTLMNGDLHKKHRRLMMPAFQKSSLDGYAADIADVADEALRAWPVGRTTDIAALLRDITVDIALRCIFGLERTDEGKELGDMMTRTLAALIAPLAVALPFPIPGTPYRDLLDATEGLRDGLSRLIARKRAQATGQRDALSLMIRAHDEDGAQFTDDELLGEVNTLFAAGYDTSAQTLAWTLFLLAQHPEVYAAAVDEVSSVLRGAPPTAEDIGKLVLVDRIVKESMRLIPATPALFIRVCASEVELGPYTLPEGANVVLSPYITQRDPALYPEPARFRPARWEGIQPTVYEYLPFGAGPRTCLGAGFAAMSLRIVLPMILQRYRLTLAHGARIDRVVRGIVLGQKHGLPMLIAPQDRHFRRREDVRGDVHEMVDLS